MELFMNISALNNSWNISEWLLREHEYDSLPDACFHLLDILDLFHIYYIPGIIFIGLVGNFLSCVVFLQTHLRLRSSSYYLAALASADFGFLISLLLVWLNNNLGLRLFNREGWCQGLVYVSSVCSFLSVWLIVAFTVERFIAIQYPLHRPHMCTVTRAKGIVLGLTLIALVSHSYSFVTAGLVQVDGIEVCDLREGYHEAMRLINIVDSLLTLILPLGLILVMNTMITQNLLQFGRRFKRERQAQINLIDRPDINLNHRNTSFSSSSQARRGTALHRSFGRETPPPVTRASTSQQSETRRCIHVTTSGKNMASSNTQQSVTKLLLLISTVFVLLNLPSYAIRLYVFVRFSLWRKSTPPSLWCLQQFFMLLYYTNFSINFLLYSMWGVTFRRCLWKLLRNKLNPFAKSNCRSRCHRTRR